MNEPTFDTEIDVVRRVHLGLADLVPELHLTQLKWIYNDGGRKAAGFKGTAGDCVCRAICIATGRPYSAVYSRLAHGMGTQPAGKRERRRGRSRSASKGITVKRTWFKAYMRELGFTWHPCMAIGQGCKVHLRTGELPKGRLIVSVSKHYTTMIDGILHDTHNPDRGGKRCVYGYWKLEARR